MNSFIALLLQTLGITEADTVKISKIMDAYNIQPCITRDVLQAASRGEQVGKTLVPLMQFKALELLTKESNVNIADLNPRTIDGRLEIGN